MVSLIRRRRIYNDSKMSVGNYQRKSRAWIPACSVVRWSRVTSRGESLSACLRVTQKNLCVTAGQSKSGETHGSNHCPETKGKVKPAGLTSATDPNPQPLKTNFLSRGDRHSRNHYKNITQKKVIQPRRVFEIRKSPVETEERCKQPETVVIPLHNSSFQRTPGTAADSHTPCSAKHQVQPSFPSERAISSNNGQQPPMQNRKVPFQFRDLKRTQLNRTKMSQNSNVGLSVGAHSVKRADVISSKNCEPRFPNSEGSSRSPVVERPGQSASSNDRGLVRPRIVRSNTSTGQYPSVFALVPQRATKSARLIRQIPDSDTSSEVPPETVIRQSAAKLEDDIIHGNFQKFVSDMSHLSRDDRRRVVTFKAGAESKSSSVFFRAVQLARVQFVEHMLKECSPNLEQTGILMVTDDSVLYEVTPLWLAAVSGQEDVVGLLLEAGADVNAKATSGSSVTRAACCMSRVTVVKQLLLYNPHMRDGNSHGVTCLMNSVQCPELIRILVARGAKINETDAHGNTALHHAIEDGRMESVKMLFELGANLTIINNDGLNAIQMAAKERQSQIAEYLLRSSGSKVADIIDAYELLAVMMILEEGNFPLGTQYWHKALTLRELNKSKVVSRKPSQKSVLFQLDETPAISSVKDLVSISSDPDALAFQALLMYERMRGSRHDTFLTLLMYRGAALADNNNLRPALKFWKLSYELYQDKYTRLHSNEFDCWNAGLMRSLQFLVKGLHEAKFEQQTQSVNSEFEFNESCLVPEALVRDMCRLVRDHVIRSSENSEIFLLKQTGGAVNESLDCLLKSSLCLFSAYLDLFSSSERSEDIGHFLREIIKLNPRDSQGRTLLHLCFDILPESLQRSGKLSGNISWPSYTLVDILFLLGARPEQTDCQGNSVLHAATAYHSKIKSLPFNLFRMLLKRGAHVDQTNHAGSLPVDGVSENDDVRQVLTHISLKCLSARIIALYSIQYLGEIPVSLYSFVQLHECL